MTEICNDDRLFHLKRLPGFFHYSYLDKDANITTYKINIESSQRVPC